MTNAAYDVLAYRTVRAIFLPLYDLKSERSAGWYLLRAIHRAKEEMPDWMIEAFFGKRDHLCRLIPEKDVPRLPMLLALAFVTAYEITGNAVDAAEVVSDALVGVINLPFEPDNFDAYFLRAVRNRAYSKLRSRRYRQKNEWAACDGAIDALENSSSVHDIGLAMDVRTAVNGLESPYREVAGLHYLEGYTRSEIALKLGESLTTINNWIHKARCKLRITLAAYDVTNAA